MLKEMAIDSSEVFVFVSVSVFTRIVQKSSEGFLFAPLVPLGTNNSKVFFLFRGEQSSVSIETE